MQIVFGSYFLNRSTGLIKAPFGNRAKHINLYPIDITIGSFVCRRRYAQTSGVKWDGPYWHKPFVKIVYCKVILEM
jgi:hypothetical protein